MTQQNSVVETSLLYPTQSAPIKRVDIAALRSLFDMLGLSVNDIRVQNDDYIFIDCGPVEAVIVACDVAFPADHFEGADFPAADTSAGRRIRADLERHSSSLTVVVANKETGDTDAQDPERNQRLGWNLLYLLMEMTFPQVIFWSGDDRVMTPDVATEAVREYHRAHPFALRKSQSGHSAAQKLEACPEQMLQPISQPASHPAQLAQFTTQPILSSDALEWFHVPKSGKGANLDDDETTGLPGIGNWLRKMSHISRASVAMSLATTAVSLCGLPDKASAALGRLF